MILAVILSSMDSGDVVIVVGILILALAANQYWFSTNGTNTMWIECLVGRAAISAGTDNVLGVS